MKAKFEEYAVNQEIKAKTVRVIDTDGKQIGVMSILEALRLANDRGLDLVEIVPKASPPVCKIMDYGKYKYEQSKEEKKKKKPAQIKEINLHLNIQQTDLQLKIKKATEFLLKGNKVLIRLFFRGREIIYANKGKELLTSIANELNSISKVERNIEIRENIATLLLTPKKDAKDKNKNT